ncbi:uncharacterized protein [Diadema setosum]|uniref:uncharacterized protein n=1 Tax=Diadema setosum TaxID=31175 RepID=UPI003B3B13DB
MPKKREREEQPGKAAKRAKFRHEVDEERMSDDVDTLLKGIALDISNNEDIENLGRQLGFNLGEIQNFIKTNNRYHEVTSDGTVSMLRKWSQRVSSSSLRSDLREALMRAKLVRIAETHLPSDSSGSPSSVPASKGSTNDRVQKIQKDLRNHYIKMYSSVRTSSLYWKSSMELDEIYTNLVMLPNDNSDEGRPIKYDDFIELLEQIDTKRGIRKRIAISGEAGVGKTTFLAKLALDWALGRCLQTIDLLFLIHLREIEESKIFSHTIMNKLSDDLKCNWVEVDEYIRTNQQKVLILYDGLDEYGQDITVEASIDVTPAVIRGEKFKNSRVIVTTRPWKADRIRSDEKLKKQYTFVKIVGFKPSDVSCYISKVFQNNEEARESLTRLMTEKDSLVAQHMAPYPIYCSMLCFIWRNEGSRSVIQELKTFSKLFDRLILLLNEHYAGKVTDQEDQQKKLEQGNVCLQNFGKDALYSLLRNELVFRETDLTTSKIDLQTACDIGVLTREKRFVPRWENKKTTKLVVEYRIPHKLFHEYLAGIHLAWLYENNPAEFNQLKKQLIDDYQGYRYLLYFTAAQRLDASERSDKCDLADKDDSPASAALLAGRGICSLPNLRSMELHGVQLHDAFYTAMASMASQSKICGPAISPATSEAYAKSICTMPNLQTLELLNVNIADDFFFALCRSAAGSKLQSIRHWERNDMSPAASEAYAKSICTMPNLQTLKLEVVKIADDFFLALCTSAEGAKLQSIIHREGPAISPSASEAYAKSICTMPNLETLELFDVKIAVDFFFALDTSAVGAKLQSITHRAGPDISAAASEAYAKSICTMPNLETLRLVNVKIADDFFFALDTSAAGAKLQSITHHAGPDISPAASEAYAKSICTMPNLETLELFDVKIADDFFLGLDTSAAGAKLQSITHRAGPDISPAASEAYAKSICTMPNLETLQLYDVKIADDFFLALVPSATGAKLQSITHRAGPDISPAASDAYAMSICTMPNLETLRLVNVKIADDFFFALDTSAAGAKLQSITHQEGPDTSPAASEAYAKSICTMPNLETLRLVNVKIADDFFFALDTSAAGAKLQSITHQEGPDTSPAASEAYAKSICTMPNLETLRLVNVKIADDFFFALDTSAAGAKLQSITHRAGPAISPAASEAYAKSICTMPNLETLELFDVKIADDFFFALDTSAAGAKLQSIEHWEGPAISPAASEAYAKSICTMPNLETLRLVNVKIADDFFFALDTSAAGAKLQSIVHQEGPDISPAASESYAKSICTMPNLKTLELVNVKIADDFFLALRTSAAGAKLQSIVHQEGPDISPAASVSYAKSVCTMPNLETLELVNVKIADDFFLVLITSAAGAKLQSIQHKEGPAISPTASKNYAKSICTMPSLQRLQLHNVKIADNFFFALDTSAVGAKVDI